MLDATAMVTRRARSEGYLAVLSLSMNEKLSGCKRRQRRMKGPRKDHLMATAAKWRKWTNGRPGRLRRWRFAGA